MKCIVVKGGNQVISNVRIKPGGDIFTEAQKAGAKGLAFIRVRENNEIDSIGAIKDNLSTSQKEQLLKLVSATERREREDRANTLFQVFYAASNLIIFIIMIIYLLKAIQVDVTPIIASAGIIGLAAAFGAQELVRDFFAGFFILLENETMLNPVFLISFTFFGFNLFKFFSVCFIKSTTIVFINFLTNSFLNLSVFKFTL